MTRRRRDDRLRVERNHGSQWIRRRRLCVRRRHPDHGRLLSGHRRPGRDLRGRVLRRDAELHLRVDTTAWGWIHLILGLRRRLRGVRALRCQDWARVIGVTFAMLSAIANFFFIPYYPFWAILIISLDIWVIWALTRHRFVGGRADEVAVGEVNEDLRRT